MMDRAAAVGALGRWALLALLALGGGVDARAQDDAELFETRIRPLLARQCYSCHGSEKQFAALRVDSRESLLAGGAGGPALIPGEPAQSLLLRAVRGDTLRMPLGGELTPDEIAALTDWIERGAPWPADAPTVDSGDDRYSELLRSHWAFQPVSHPSPPVENPATELHVVDRFIRAKLDEQGLRPAPSADRRTLARRLYYTLTGLPPSDDQVRAFENDPLPRAYEDLVERLLASPRFGERWARHWLDLVRYAETRGYEWNYEIIGAWRYRDYLIRAFNGDVPYDQFVREHVAGDLLDRPRINHEQNINESVIGTAFYRLGEAGHDDCVKFREIALDVVDNQIDVLSKTFQGMTVACARCHDHKLDPIPTVDYYGLYSILNSSRVATHTIDTPAAREATLSELRSLKDRIRDELAAMWASQVGAAANDLAIPRTPAEGEPPALEDPAWPAHSIQLGMAEGKDFGAAYAAAIERLRQERELRIAHNREKYQPFGSFRDGAPDSWSAEGLGLQEGPSPHGDFAVASEGEAALLGVYPAGTYTHTLSARLNGAVRSPLLHSAGPKKLSLLAVGGMLSAHRTVIDNCAIGEDYKFVEATWPQWTTIDIKQDWAKLPVFIELVTRWDNPRIPDRPGKIKDPQLSLVGSPESYFGIVDAVLHDEDEPPRDELTLWTPLLDGPAPSDWNELADRYREIVSQALNRWRRGDATEQDSRWLALLLEKGLLENRASSSEKLDELIQEYRRLENSLPEPRVVEGLADAGEGHDFPVLLGGSAGSPGKPAPRRFLSRLHGDEPLTTHGSGRAELAELLASRDNPLTARVMANRIWSYLFGRGVVATVDDFGSLGEKPTHPELLDHLASRFMEEGWSIKTLIRYIVASEAFRQSGAVSAEAVQVDPQNTLLHHYSVRRLSAEELRDTLLSIGGELQSTLYGPSLDPYRKRPEEYRRLFSGPLLGDGRRSLYQKVTRMEGAAFLETFDFPLPATTRGVRDSTTVPAQSLTLLNDPFVLAIAERSAQRLPTTAAPAERIDTLFRAVLSRPASPEETARFLNLRDRLLTLYDADSPEVWRDVAHVLLNSKELLYVE